MEALSELCSSVRRQGLRGDTLLTDTDDLLQRYRSLEATLQQQAEILRVLEEDCRRFDTQTDSTRTWVRDQQQRQHHQIQKEERIHTAQVCQ